MDRWKLIEIQGVKKELQTLKFLELIHMSTKFAVNLCPKTNVCCDVWYFRVISTPDAVCGSQASQIIFQHFLSYKRAIVPEIPGFAQITWQVIFTRFRDTPTSLIGSGYNKTLGSPLQYQILCRQWTRHGSPVRCPAQSPYFNPGIYGCGDTCTYW